MTTPHRNRIKQLERIDVELAVLRDQSARIKARIVALEAARRTGILEVASETVGRLDLSQVPVSQLLARLMMLNEVEHDDDDSAATEEAVDRQRDDNIKTFFKLSRNTTAEKRAILEASGLHWNGRAAGWTGSVGSAELARLHLVFKNRVTPQPMIDAGDPPAPSHESAADPLRVDEGQDAVQPYALETRTTREGEPVEQGVVRPAMTTLFRGLPLRRPPARPPEPESPA